MRYLDRPKHARGIPWDQINAQAVIHAYRDEGLTIKQCSDKFTTSESAIKTILRDNDVDIRTPGYRRPVESVLLEQPAKAEPSLSPKDAERGPVEREVREAGINDRNLLAMAAYLDGAVIEGRRSTTLESERHAHRRTAAQLARVDRPEGAPADTASESQPERRVTRRINPTSSKAHRA